MSNKDKYLELARKVYELVKRGVEGERDVAESKLKSMMVAHGITIEDIEGEAVFYQRCRCKKEDFKFMSQVVSSVQGKGAYHWEMGFAYFDSTDAELIEIGLKFNFYLEKLKENYEAMYFAFIQKNELYRRETEKEREERQANEVYTEQSEVERKALELMETMKPEQFRKQLSNGKG